MAGREEERTQEVENKTIWKIILQNLTFQDYNII